MKELKDRELLLHYLHAHGIENKFNEQIMPHLSLYLFHQGEAICSQGEPSQYLYVLVKGKVKIYTTSLDGKTLILSFKTPLDLIGDIEYIQGIDIMNTVEAVSVEVRLASYLLSVSFDESDCRFQGQFNTATLRDVANLIGTSYRHLNRVIQLFCKEGLIARNRGFILVKDRDGLRALANHNIYE
ncbi:Crp/Fnr family transcriptional regulator [Paenibacillus sp. SI8]|uniref:Crp/Fnr family transcriptional regulator n=1 Tax=unclassified Paenibacillus TaxID=185978 RepID=UPI0034656932